MTRMERDGATMLVLALAASLAAGALGALPPGPGPFAQVVMRQPVPGALRFRGAKLCDVSKPPYSAANATNATGALARAIDDCGDLPGGGTVPVPGPPIF